MAKFDPLKMLLGPLAGGTIYDSPIAQFLSIKDPEEKRRLAAEAKKEEEAAAAKAGVKQAPDMRQALTMKRGGAVKKMAGGGATKKMPSLADSVASGNRMSGKEEAPFRTPKPKFGPTPAERAASKAQDERLKNAKVTRGEVRTLNSANRSEGGVKMAKGGSTASRRADGCATRGKTRGKIY